MKLFSCSHSQEWEQLNKRMVDVETRLLRLELSEEAFRNKVLRKIQAPKGDKTEEKGQDIYSQVLLPEA